jgi:hypothetical protein
LFRIRSIGGLRPPFWGLKNADAKRRLWKRPSRRMEARAEPVAILRDAGLRPALRMTAVFDAPGIFT